MTTYADLISKYNAEEVGDRLIAMVNGQKQYIANKEAGGGFSLTYHGLQLEAQTKAAEPVAEDKPAKAVRKKKDIADNDLLAGLDAVD